MADHVKVTGNNIKWDHFDILAKGKTDYHCKKKRLYLFKNLSQLSTSTAKVNALLIFSVIIIIIIIIIYFTVKCLLNLDSSPFIGFVIFK